MNLLFLVHVVKYLKNYLFEFRIWHDKKVEKNLNQFGNRPERVYNTQFGQHYQL